LYAKVEGNIFIFIIAFKKKYVLEKLLAIFKGNSIERQCSDGKLFI
jgi:hypothetical protein